MDKDTILSLFKAALKIESDGANFYSMAAKNSKDNSTREIFEFLAQEEKKHYEFFMGPLKTLEKGESFDYSGAVKNMKSDLKEVGEVFDADFIKRLKGDNYSLSAVSIGIHLEKNSIGFYREQKEKEKDPDALKFYDFLINTEVSHHDILVNMEKEMLEHSWNENRFSPF